MINGLAIDPIAITQPTFNAANVQAAGGSSQTVGAGFWNSILSVGQSVVSTAKQLAPIAKTAKDIKAQIDAAKQQSQNVINNTTTATGSGSSGSSGSGGISSGSNTALLVGIVGAGLLLSGGIIYAVVKASKKKTK